MILSVLVYKFCSFSLLFYFLDSTLVFSIVLCSLCLS